MNKEERGVIHVGPGRDGNIAVLRGLERFKYWPMRVFKRQKLREKPFIRVLYKVVDSPSGRILQVTNLHNMLYPINREKGEGTYKGYGSEALWEATRELHSIATRKNRGLKSNGRPGEGVIKEIKTFPTAIYRDPPPWGWKILPKETDGPSAVVYSTGVMGPEEFERAHPRPDIRKKA